MSDKHREAMIQVADPSHKNFFTTAVRREIQRVQSIALYQAPNSDRRTLEDPWYSLYNDVLKHYANIKMSHNERILSTGVNPSTFEKSNVMIDGGVQVAPQARRPIGSESYSIPDFYMFGVQYIECVHRDEKAALIGYIDSMYHQAELRLPTNFRVGLPSPVYFREIPLLALELKPQVTSMRSLVRQAKKNIIHCLSGRQPRRTEQVNGFTAVSNGTHIGFFEYYSNLSASGIQTVNPSHSLLNLVPIIPIEWSDDHLYQALFMTGEGSHEGNLSTVDDGEWIHRILLYILFKQEPDSSGFTYKTLRNGIVTCICV